MVPKPIVEKTEVIFSLKEESSHLGAFLARLGLEYRKDAPAGAFSAVAEDFADGDDERVLSVEVHHHPEASESHWTISHHLAPGKSPPERVTELSRRLGWKAGVFKALQEEWSSLAAEPVECSFTVSFSLQRGDWTTKLAPPPVKTKVPGAKHATSSVVWEFNDSGPMQTLLIAQGAEQTLMVVLSGRMETFPRQGMLEEVQNNAWDLLRPFITKKKKKA